MEMLITSRGTAQFRKVYSGVEFLSDGGEPLAVTMRDGGYELDYAGQRIRLVKGSIETITKPVAETLDSRKVLHGTFGELSKLRRGRSKH